MSSHTNEMTMVARVASALQVSTDKGFASWEEAARAAIEAMKNPTGRMEAASARIAHATDRQIYQAMIDAALQEKQG